MTKRKMSLEARLKLSASMKRRWAMIKCGDMAKLNLIIARDILGKNTPQDDIDIIALNEKWPGYFNNETY